MLLVAILAVVAVVTLAILAVVGVSNERLVPESPAYRPFDRTKSITDVKAFRQCTSLAAL